MIGQKHIGRVRRREIVIRAHERSEEHKHIRRAINNLSRYGECEINTERVSESSIKKIRALLPKHEARYYWFRVEISII